MEMMVEDDEDNNRQILVDNNVGLDIVIILIIFVGIVWSGFDHVRCQKCLSMWLRNHLSFCYILVCHFLLSL